MSASNRSATGAPLHANAPRASGTLFQSPSLEALPPAPGDRSGWPWTEVSSGPGSSVVEKRAWPRISVVTPSYNQCAYLEETLRSVLLQGYPNLEYIVIDGGSTDGSVEVIRRYAPWLHYWVSEPDRGQGHAINKGWSQATGEILSWLNSDDLYEPGALAEAAKVFAARPDAAVVYGEWSVIDEHGVAQERMPAAYTRQKLLEYWRGYYGIGQPASFLSRRVLEQQGPLDERWRYIMDYEYFIRAGAVGPFVAAHAPLARFRVHRASKTSSNRAYFAEEHLRLARRRLASAEIDLPRDYLMRARWHFSDALITSLLEGRPFRDRHPAIVLTQAAWYHPGLLRKRWIWKLAARCVVGPKLMPVARRLRGRA